MSDHPARSRILDYLLITLSLPLVVWMELNEASRDISLALTGGKYSGYGQINRRRRGDDPAPDWLRPPDCKRENFRLAVWRAKNRRYLEKRSGPGGIPELVLTQEGRAKALKTFPLLKLALRPWKGWWLVVAFDIPETDKKNRESVRKQLTRIGFVQWQKSVYVSPHDIADDLAKLLKGNNLENKVVPMIAKRILAGNDWDFARRLFHIDQIEADYRQLEESLKSFQNSKMNPREFLRRKFSQYINILRRDPLLPVGLTPKSGYGRESTLKALQTFAVETKSEEQINISKA